jgi:signal transduction histidine kinase/CHASE3 domain sensor protein
MVHRLWTGLALLVLLIIAAAALVFQGERAQDKVADSIVSRLHPLEIANLESRADFASCQSVLRAYLLTRELRYLTIYEQDRSDFIQVAAYAAEHANRAQLRNLAVQQRQANAWFLIASEMQPLRQGSAKLAALTNQGFAHASGYYNANQRLNGQLERQSTRALTAAARDVDHAAQLAGLLAVVVALLAVAAGVMTIRNLTRPLGALAGVLRRLTAGDHAARAQVAGPAEIAEVATSLNALADESDRLRALEAESNRVRAVALATGVRIRAHLRVEDVLTEACQALEESLVADAAYLHVVRDGGLGAPIGHEHDWLMPAEFASHLTGDTMNVFRDLLRRRESLVIQDLASPDARVRRPIRQALLDAGIRSQVMVPFGAGDELLGLIVACRFSTAQPWSESEVYAVESIAADVGRALHHARLYEAENRLVDELRAVDQAKSDFLATVSHELRTPLTSIAGYIEILRERDAGPLTSVQEKMLGTVERNTARLRHLIEDVLTLSKIESGAFKTTRQPVNLTDVAAAAVTALQPAAVAKGVSVTAEHLDSRLIVGGDPGQLDRLMINLFSNAVKFTPEGGRVRVSAGSQGLMAVLTVGDSGIGIPQSEQKALFTRFFRASNAVHHSIPGTGLGLAIVRTIVANHGGELAVKSSEGEGTTVTVRIPLLAAGSTATGMPVAGEGWPA